jgi:hypothetical protein
MVAVVITREGDIVTECELPGYPAHPQLEVWDETSVEGLTQNRGVVEWV